MPFPPDTYLIGAQKAGTTTLAYLLDQHPRISVSQPKETHFFTHNWDKGLEWYGTRFPEASPNHALVDASTSYSMASLRSGAGGDLRGSALDNVPERVNSINPDAKFIYLLRDPVERSYSGYWHSVRTGRESRDFGKVLSQNNAYLDVSDYSGQLSLWLEYFPLESFLFVLFEDMKESPENTVAECFWFLGKEADVSVRLDSAKNRSYNNTLTGRRINKLFIDRPRLAKSLTSLRPLVPQALREKMRERRTGSEPVPGMKQEDREFLVGYFRDKNRKLSELTGISLDKWQA